MPVNGRPNSAYGVSVAAVLKQIRAAAVSEDATRSAPTDDASGAVLLMLLESPDHLVRHCHVNRKLACQMSMAATVHAATVAWRHVSIA